MALAWRGARAGPGRRQGVMGVVPICNPNFLINFSFRFVTGHIRMASPDESTSARCCRLVRLEFCQYSRIFLAHHDKRAFSLTPVSCDVLIFNAIVKGLACQTKYTLWLSHVIIEGQSQFGGKVQFLLYYCIFMHNLGHRVGMCSLVHDLHTPVETVESKHVTLREVNHCFIPKADGVHG